MKEIDIGALNFNPCTSIGNDWMIITAGNKDDFNMMTASWGHIGALWGNSLYGRPTVEVFVRPSRYTDKYLDEYKYFSLCFFEEKYRNDLLYIGSKSGKNEDKLNHTDLTVSFIDDIPYYNEAKLVIIARKIYKGKIEKDGIIDKSIIESFYKKKSEEMYNNPLLHNIYIGEIVKVLVKD